MSDLVVSLRDADTTRRIGESYADTHERRQRDRNEAAAEVERLRNLVQCLLDNDPNEAITDAGHTVLDKWRYDARQALAQEKPND